MSYLECSSSAHSMNSLLTPEQEALNIRLKHATLMFLQEVGYAVYQNALIKSARSRLSASAGHKTEPAASTPGIWPCQQPYLDSVCHSRGAKCKTIQTILRLRKTQYGIFKTPEFAVSHTLTLKYHLYAPLVSSNGGAFKKEVAAHPECDAAASIVARQTGQPLVAEVHNLLHGKFACNLDDAGQPLSSQGVVPWNSYKATRKLQASVFVVSGRGNSLHRNLWRWSVSSAEAVSMISDSTSDCAIK